jgi:hypothetical protein
MLNDRLYNALRDLFQQEPEVCNEGEDAEFSCPPSKFSPIGRKRKRRRYAQVERWGECYAVNCPVCGDQRKRLWFCNLYGMTTKMSKVTYYFGRVYTCYNERCNLHSVLKGMTYDEDQAVVTTKPSTFINIVQMETTLPQGCLPLRDPGVPAYVPQYLYGRGFDPTGLFNDYYIHYAPKGTVYTTTSEGVDREFYEDRLLIPIIQGGRLVGFQARRISDEAYPGGKYLTVNAKTARALYNRDVAMFHRDVVIVEGPTDVWRVGPEAVALFGKTLKSGQRELMKLLWGFSGSCVVVLDADAEHTKTSRGTPKPKDSDKVIASLRRHQVFPRGVAKVVLPVGMDPAQLPQSEIRDRIAEARTQCSR